MNKKSVKKALLLVLCAILLVVASVMGTLAYLTSSDKVVNTFSVGHVTITLDEAKTNEKGQPLDAGSNVVDLADAARWTGSLNTNVGNLYHLIPGSQYTKDPTVKVSANSEDCWIFVEVDNGISGIEGGTTIAEQIIANDWKQLNGTTNVYYRNHSKLAAETPYVVFENFTVDAAKTNDQLAAVASANITVTAYAIQEENVGASAATEAEKVEAAWIALGKPDPTP